MRVDDIHTRGEQQAAAAADIRSGIYAGDNTKLGDILFENGKDIYKTAIYI